jgi:hypothetical protein
MPQFIIIELEDGLMVVELLPGQQPEEAAAAGGGMLVDPGPYSSFEEADDALMELQEEAEDERD